MNTKAAYSASILVAVIAFLSSIYIFSTMDRFSGLLTILFGIVWIGIGFYFKSSGETKNKKNKTLPKKQNHKK